MKIEKLKKEEYLKFYQSLKGAKEVNKCGCYLSLEEPDYYLQTDNFIFEEGVGGFAITKDGDLIAVHKNPAIAKERKIGGGILHMLMLSALVNGAKKLDCYGSALATIYMKYGFVPVARMKFSREYNPDFPAEYGEPDVITMLNPIATLALLNEQVENNSLSSYDQLASSLPYFEDYNAMLEYRDQILEEAEEKGLSYNDVIKHVINYESSKEAL